MNAHMLLSRTSGRFLTLGVCLCVRILLPTTASQAQDSTAYSSYQELKQALREVLSQKKNIIKQYYASSRDFEVAYRKYTSAGKEQTAAWDMEVKLLKGVAPVEEIVRLDELNQRYRQLSGQLKRVPDEDGVYDTVDEPARPRQGTKAFYRTIIERLRYPALARQKQTEGKVYLQFVVDEYGVITRPRVLKGLGDGCDREALRVLRKATAWHPGRIEGHAVRSRVILPITFRLHRETSPEPLQNFVVSDQDQEQSYDQIKKALRRIERLKAEIMQKHYTSARDLQLAYQDQLTTTTDQEVDILQGVLSADEATRLQRLSEIRSRLQEKLKHYPNADGVFEVVDHPPHPADGYPAFYAYLAKHLRYPKPAREAQIEGKVYVRLIVNEDGTLMAPKVIKGIGAGCDREAVRILKKVSRWKPARTDDKPVKAKVIIPITFQLR